MPALPPSATKVHLDQDSDDIYQARVELEAHTDKINSIISYLAGLFGSDGVKLTALNTLGAGFPAFTHMVFLQATVPLGWIRVTPTENFYLSCATGGDGAQVFGSFSHGAPTNEVVLARGHLPSVDITGVTSWTGDHVHSEQLTAVAASGAPAGALRIPRWQQNDPQSYDVWYTAATSGGGGTHYHDVTIPLGGSNWGHSHFVDFSGYRPRALLVVIGYKS